MSEKENLNTPACDDDFVIGKGFKVKEDKKIKKKKPKKQHSAIRSVIWVISILVISVGLACGVIYAGADFTGIGFGRGEDATIEIEMGATSEDIAEELKESGAVKIPMLFRLYAKLKNYDSRFQYGVYTFNTEAGYDAICQMLITEGAKAESVEVTIPEGTGIYDFTKNVNGEDVTVPGIITLLEKAGVCTKSDFLDALEKADTSSELLQNADSIKTYHTLEGYLFPETYSFYCYESAECAQLAVNKMLKEAEKRITEDMFLRAEELEYSMNEILTLASIVQMESGESTDDMAGVAGVFYNRLNSEDFATLGSSPTCYYGNAFRHDDGRYNTYTAEGLPPGPLCSPGIDAINAVLYPKDSDYYYFVTDSDGNFYYHKTLEEQNITIAKLQKGQKWIYEYFD